MRTTNIRYLYGLKKSGIKIFFSECPICTSVFGSTQKDLKTCSEYCDKKTELENQKIEKARELILKNNLARAGDTVLGSYKASVFKTNFNETTLAQGKKQFTYILKANDSFVKINSIEPLKKSGEIKISK
jgi:hypothetical protein